LPDHWIEKIFSIMEAMYGARFHDAWRGTDLQLVKATWAERLAAFEDDPQCIKFALNSLDSKPFPPTLPEFIELCRQGPKTFRLPAAPAMQIAPPLPPEAAAERAREVQRKAVESVRHPPNHLWAIRILDEIAEGVQLPAISEESAIEALLCLGLKCEVPERYIALQRVVWMRLTEKAA
jgi:hypothetical protein